jgi:hypothetical protein
MMQKRIVPPPLHIVRLGIGATLHETLLNLVRIDESTVGGGAPLKPGWALYMRANRQG